MTVFAVSFEQWIADGETRSLAAVGREVWGDLGALAGGR